MLISAVQQQLFYVIFFHYGLQWDALNIVLCRAFSTEENLSQLTLMPPPSPSQPPSLLSHDLIQIHIFHRHPT